MEKMSILLLSLLFAWQRDALFVVGEIQFKKGAPHVTLTNGGLISGAVKFSRNGRPYNSFSGIPYATVPERFQEPQSLTAPAWQGVFEATKRGSACPQQNLFGNRELIGEEKDCLNLNVYVPISNSGTGKKGYPIMVWLHPGGFMYGTGYEYGPQFFMDEDVIIITLNYRLGVFGFLSTGDNIIPGNNGLKDMVVALKWVQDNLKVFGGDTARVTIFGESSGGIAVNHLILSPTAKGLFHRAISQSGSALNPWSNDPNPKESAVELATYLKCPSAAGDATGITSEEILTCLKRLPVDELNKAQFEYKTNWSNKIRPVFFGPTVERVDPTSQLTPFQSELSVSILANKANNLTEIPWMVGTVKDEGAGMHTGFMSLYPEIFKEINMNWNSIAPLLFGYEKYLTQEGLVQVSQKIKQFYFGDKDITEETAALLATAFGDELVLHGVYKSAMETAARGKRNRVYLYQYDYKGPLSIMGMGSEKKEDDQTVGHADDLQHLFDVGEMFPGGSEIIKPDTPHEEFSKNFVRLWASFAIHGEPKHSWGNATFNRWKSISKKGLDGVGPLRWFRIETNAVLLDIDQSTKDRMQFWDGLWNEHFTPAILAKHESFKTVSNEKTEL